MKGRLIIAKFNGKCRQCGKATHKGDYVYFAKHFGVRCDACGPHPADEQPLPPKKGSKRYQRQMGSEPAPSQSEPPTERADLDCDGIHRLQFGSIGEAVRDALSDYAQNDTARERIAETFNSAVSGHSEWGNYFTKDRLLAELNNPSQELLSAVDRMREHLMGEIAMPATPRRKIRRGLDDGDELDADRWLRRDPAAWEKTVREPTAKRNVTIGCNLSVSCSRKPHELLYRGAAALALADILTQQGYNVRILAFKVASDPTSHCRKVVSRYELKDSSMPLDMSAVAFAMCEIAFVRIVAVCGTMRHLPGRPNVGWGSPCSLPSADRRDVDFLIEQDVLSEERAVEWLKAQLAGQAVQN